MDGFARNFARGGRLADVITCFKLCVDRLRGFGSARGRIIHSPLTWPVAINTPLRYRAPVIWGTEEREFTRAAEVVCIKTDQKFYSD